MNQQTNKELRSHVDIQYKINRFLTNTNNSEYMNILYLNIQSLRSQDKFENLKNLIISFKFTIHIIILSEIWIFSMENDQYHLNNYNEFFVNRDDEIAGGTVIYVLDSIPSNVTFEESTNRTDFLIIELSELKINIMSVYKNNDADLQLFFQKFENLISSHSSRYPLYIFGDFNINILNSNESSVINYLDIINTNGLFLVNPINSKNSTRITDRSKTLIDHCITNNIINSLNFSLFDTSCSDHRGIVLNISKTNPPKLNHTLNKTILSYENIDMKELERHLVTTDNFNTLIDHCKNTIINNTNTIQFRKKSLKSPWITNCILKEIKKRDKFYRLKKNHPLNEYYQNQFKFFKNKITRLINTAKNNYFTNRLKDTSSKILWDLLNEHVKRKPTNRKTISLIRNNTIISDEKHICNEFNYYFTHCIDEMFPFNTFCSSNIILPTFELIYTFSITPTTPQEISKHISNLNKKSATGYDNISSKFCDFIGQPLAILLSKLINKQIDLGNFPDCLKISRVTAIHKSGSTRATENYRPISILPTFSKIFEMVLYDRLENHCINNNIINKRQFGFCRGSNTLAAVSEFINYVKQSLDEKFFVSCIFVDFRKAFDSVEHNLMIKKLQNIGINGKDLQLFESFLKNRYQFVKINNEQSNLELVRFGVPQGSLTGPLLFNIYSNDVFQIKLNGHLIMYADDQVIINKAKTIDELFQKMNSDLTNINSWTLKNHLQINPAKTNYIIFEMKNKSLDECSYHHLKLNNSIIQRTLNSKYLGLVVDSKLSFNNHVNLIKNKLSQTCFLLKQLRHILPIKFKLQIFNAFHVSHIRYLLPIWSSTSQLNIQSVHIMTNRALRIIKNKPFLSPTAELYDTYTLKISQLIIFELIFLIYKIKNGFIKNNFELQQINEIHNYDTRQASHFYINFSRTNISYQNFLYKGLNLFNNLPGDIKMINSISKFKIELKKHITHSFD